MIIIMSRRFVHMIVDKYIGRGQRRPAYGLHRIDPWRCFYPTRAQALESANNKATTVEDARLPRSALSLFHPCPADDSDFGMIEFKSLGCNSNSIISMDQDGNTLLYDAASSAVRAMPAPHAPKSFPISLPVGDSLYLLNSNPAVPQKEHHPFEVLTPRAGCFEEGWSWRSLQPPPFSLDDDYGDFDLDGKVEDYLNDGGQTCSYVIKAYSVVGDSQIWVSTKTGGTFSFDTASSVWSMPGEWALPFSGRVHYAPELGLWFGFSSKTMQFAASDLGAASAARPPVLHKLLWDELVPPLQERWVLVMAYLLPLGAGKFCIARVFDMAEEGWRRDKDYNNYDSVESFAVFTGVEVERGSKGTLRMIRHKSRRYSCGHRPIQTLL